MPTCGRYHSRLCIEWRLAYSPFSVSPMSFATGSTRAARVGCWDRPTGPGQGPWFMLTAASLNLFFNSCRYETPHLLNVFTTEEGLSTGLNRTYVYRECPYIRVNLEFEPVGRPARDAEGARNAFRDQFKIRLRKRTQIIMAQMTRTKPLPDLLDCGIAQATSVRSRSGWGGLKS